MQNIIGSSAAGFEDASLWEATRKRGSYAIKRLINNGLKNTSVTVVFIGAKTSRRKYVNYEIDQSIKRGNGIVGIQIHHLKNEKGYGDMKGLIPYKLKGKGYKVYKYYNRVLLAKQIEEAAKAAGK